MRICCNSNERASKLPGVNVCPTTHAKWSHVHHQGCTVFAWSITSGIISHIMKALVPLPCFLFSHTPQTFFSPNNKLSHPFFITQVFQHWSSLKVREAFLWPEGHIVWICQICNENLGGVTDWIHDGLHQSALEQHIVLSLASVQLLRTVCNPVSPVVTTSNLLKFINKQLHLMFAGLFWNKCVTKRMLNPCFVISNNRNNWITLYGT